MSLADLMMVDTNGVEESITRLAQDARGGRHPFDTRHSAAVGGRNYRIN